MELVVILGIHRSGTSLLAGGVEALGFDLRLENDESDKHNPTGYKEQAEIRTFNDRLLSHLETSWDDWSFRSGLINWDTPDMYYWVLEALEILARVFAGGHKCALKDPRITTLFPFWQRVLSKTTWKVRFLLVLRNPEEVAISQVTRATGDPDRNQLIREADPMLALWAVTMHELLKSPPEQGFLAVDFNLLQSKPDTELKAVADYLDLRGAEGAIQTFRKTHVKPELYRSRVSVLPAKSGWRSAALELWSAIGDGGTRIFDPALCEQVLESATQINALLPSLEATRTSIQSHCKVAAEAHQINDALGKINAGLFLEAEHELLKVYRSNEKNLECLYLLAESNLRMYRTEKAERYADAALEIDPNFIKVLAIKIELSVRNNDLEAAVGLLKKYPSFGETRDMYRLLRCRISLAEGDFENALFELSDLIERNPKAANERELFVIGARSVLDRKGEERADNFIDSLGLLLPPTPKLKDTSWHDPKSGSIDIIIPVYNALADLQQCLKSIDRCSEKSLNQIIIVDDASDEETACWLDLYAHSHSNVLLIRNQDNQGFTKSCVRGIGASKAPFFVLLNSDTIVSPGWMSGLWRGLDVDDRHSMVGPLSNHAYFQSLKFPVDLSVFDERTQISAVHAAASIIGAFGPPEYCKVPFVSGFCAMIRRSAYEAVNGFDTAAYPQGYWEIQDLALRMIDSGTYPCLADNVFVYHKQSASTADKRKNQLLAQGFMKTCESFGAIRVLFAEEMCRNLPIRKAQHMNLFDSFPMNICAPHVQTKGHFGSATIAVPSQLFQEHKAFVGQGPNFETLAPVEHENLPKRAKVLAYYLPQFHQVAVNDAAWGVGFTEWRQLARGIPRFAGHQQPRIPRDQGFYNLADSEVMRNQIAMARSAGLSGFCFYHYSFDGQRVLETPVEQLLNDPTLDFPFCLIWANENWTRTWDGSNQDIILRQTYDDFYDQTMIDDFARHMIDPRYIRLNGRPLLIIYRPGHIPNIRRKMDRWRELFRQQYGLEPLLFMSQTFFDSDPRNFGLDGAVEFPPHKLNENLRLINDQLQLYDKDFQGHVFAYEDVVQASLSEGPQSFPLVKCAVPSWDNEPRRPGRGMVIHGSTPMKFETWMEVLVQRAQDNPVYGEALVCVNAWNEWAEGAYLEPDVYHGAAYLNAIRRAVTAGSFSHSDQRS
jgi:GT2 family glycosyltransferase